MKKSFLFFALACMLFSCKKETSTTSSSSSTSGGSSSGSSSSGNTVPDVYTKIFGASSITSDGTFITVKTKGIPSHKSCYWPTSNALYENFANGSTTFNGEIFQKAPTQIADQNYTFKIPLKPALNSAHSATPLGPIGFALDGVALYNQYAAGGATLGNEIKGFDQYYGHPQDMGSYHYHVEPLYITKVKSSKSSLVGFLLDGFPVYGPEENGATVAESALDAYHGHTSATADYPNGTYHYHTTAVSPYINGNGFYGTPGTVSK